MGKKIDLNELLQRVRDLQTLPSVVIRINTLLSDDTISVDKIAEVLEKDPALTSKLLRLANSSYYGLSYNVDTVSKAVVVLGLNTVGSIVVTVSIAKMFKVKGQILDLGKLWIHSLGCALASEAILSELSSHESEKAYVGGLLHDIGKLILAQLIPNEYGKVLKKLKDPDSLYELENQHLEFTHAEVGAEVAGLWRFPEELTESIRYHHCPEKGDKNSLLNYSIYTGNKLIKTIIAGDDPSLLRNQLSPDGYTHLGDFFLEDSFVEGIRKNLSEILEIFG